MPSLFDLLMQGQQDPYSGSGGPYGGLPTPPDYTAPGLPGLLEGMKGNVPVQPPQAPPDYTAPGLPGLIPGMKGNVSPYGPPQTFPIPPGQYPQAAQPPAEGLPQPPAAPPDSNVYNGAIPPLPGRPDTSLPTTRVGYAPGNAPRTPPDAIKGIIADAAKTVGVDPNILTNIIGQESSFDPNATARRKDGTPIAQGLGQMTPDTFKAYLAKYGAQYGFGPDTSPTDPRANALMTAHYMKDTQDLFEKNFGRPPANPGELYAVHAHGVNGAKMLFNAPPDTSMKTLVPSAFDKSRSDYTPITEAQFSVKDPATGQTRPLTVAEYKDRLNRIASGTGPTMAGAPPGMPPGTPGSPPNVSRETPPGMPSLPPGTPTVPDLPGVQDVNTSINFGKNAPVWSTLANIGAGMINTPRHLGVLGAIGSGLQQGVKNLNEIPTRQLQQVLAQTQIGTANMTMQQKLSLLNWAQKLPPGDGRRDVIMASLAGVTRDLGVFASSLPAGTRYNAEGKIETIPGATSTTAEMEGTKEGVKDTFASVKESGEHAMAATNILDISQKIRNLLPQISGQVGWQADTLAQGRSLLGRMGFEDSDKIAPYEVAKKLLTQLSANYAKSLGQSRVTNAELITSQLANANQNMQPDAIKGALDATESEAQKVIDYHHGKLDYAQSHNGLLRDSTGSYDQQWLKSRGYLKGAPASPPANASPDNVIPKLPEDAKPVVRNGRNLFYSMKTGKYYEPQ